MRHLVLLSFFASACTGTIDSGEPGTMPPATDVQLVVRDGTSPQAGVLAIFQDPNGAVVAEVMTDARGVAAAELPSGGTLTVIRSYPVPIGEEPIPTEVYTYVGVKGGDRLSLGKPTTDEDGAASAVLVKVPELANGTVKITASCGAGQGEGPLVAITVRHCEPDVGLYVVDGNGQSFFARAPYAENIDLSGYTLADALTSTIGATNVPPGAAVSVEQRLGSKGFDFFSTGAKRVEATPQNVTLPQLGGVEHLILTQVSANNRTQIVGARKLYQDIAVVDASAGLITSVSQLDYEQSTLTWTEEGAGAPDLVIASLNVTRDETSTLDREYVRLIIAPHAGPSLRVPVLPGAGAIYNPSMDDQVGIALGVAKATGGYDAVRARAFAVPSLPAAAPVDGQITLSYSGARPGL